MLWPVWSQRIRFCPPRWVLRHCQLQISQEHRPRKVSHKHESNLRAYHTPDRASRTHNTHGKGSPPSEPRPHGIVASPKYGTGPNGTEDSLREKHLVVLAAEAQQDQPKDVKECSGEKQRSRTIAVKYPAEDRSAQEKQTRLDGRDPGDGTGGVG